MKRIISVFLMLIMLTCLFSSYSVFAADTDKASIQVKNKQGYASEAITIAVTAEQTLGISGAVLKIKYDTALELLYVENGSFFKNMAQSAIYGQSTGGVNGEYTYIGYDNGENSNKVKGTFLYLTFKLPDNAEFGDTYNVSVVKEESTLTVGTDSKKDFTVENGLVTALPSTACQTHTFPEYTVISEKASYTQVAYKYRICSSCKVAEVVKSSATNIPELITYDGVAINYTGSPSGIAPVFIVDKTKLSLLSTRVSTVQPNAKVEAGIIVYKNGEYYYEELFFGDSKTADFDENNKMFVKLENESVFAKFEFKAYIKITDTETKEQRYEYVSATYKGNEKISILDVVKGLYIKAYSKQDQTYLNKVLNGLVP